MLVHRVETVEHVSLKRSGPIASMVEADRQSISSGPDPFPEIEMIVGVVLNSETWAALVRDRDEVPAMAGSSPRLSSSHWRAVGVGHRLQRRERFEETMNSVSGGSRSGPPRRSQWSRPCWKRNGNPEVTVGIVGAPRMPSPGPRSSRRRCRC